VTAIRTLLVSLAICCAALSTPASAETRPQAGQTALKDGQVLRGRFEQDRFLKGFPSPLKTAGSFTLVAGGGLIWRAETPFSVTTVMSPAGLVQEVDGKKTMSLASTRIPFMTKLYSMLSGALIGNWSDLESTFKIARTGDAKKWELRFTPMAANDPAMPIEAILVRGKRLVEDVVVIRSDGDRDHLRFSGQNLEAAAPTSDELALLALAKEL
jgi:Outer membrane lipoprotein carrier protein LolA-like